MRIMGIDYGSRRIGVAISDPWGGMAHPLEVVNFSADGSHLARIKAIAIEYSIEKTVVGLPYNMDGTIGDTGNRAIAFAEELGRELALPVDLWDERLTTAEAHEMMISMNVKGRKRRTVVDKIAAALMLQGYLDAYSDEKP